MKRLCVLALAFSMLILSSCAETEHFEITCEPKISASDSGNFSYTIINNYEEQIEVTLGVSVSKYQNGEWVPLPFSEKFYEVHYNAFLWAEPLPSKSKRLQEFRLSLAEMVDTELTPGKYRLEKEIWFNRYYAEFEIY